MIRVKDLQVGDCFSVGRDDYEVESIMHQPGLLRIDFKFKNLRSGVTGIHCNYAEDAELLNWQFIARRVPLSPNVEIELAAARGEVEKKEKRGWEPDIVEPFFNIRDTLG